MTDSHVTCGVYQRWWRCRTYRRRIDDSNSARSEPDWKKAKLVIFWVTGFQSLLTLLPFYFSEKRLSVICEYIFTDLTRRGKTGLCACSSTVFHCRFSGQHSVTYKQKFNCRHLKLAMFNDNLIKNYFGDMLNVLNLRWINPHFTLYLHLTHLNYVTFSERRGHLKYRNL